MPTSVSEEAHQRLRSRETTSTITEQRTQADVAAFEVLGVEHPACEVLVSLSTAQREMRSYSALDKHPELPVANDTFASPSSPPTSAGWSVGHTEQTESQDSSPSSSTVSDPRTDHDSTVLSQHAHEGRDSRPASTTDRSSSPSSTGESSTAATRFLPRHEHHSVASAASRGHFALVDRNLPDSDVSRDYREGRYSFDESIDEIVVTADFSQSMALTAVRLCSALLSDAAFEQVLTPAQLADHPDGLNLEGLALSNPYVLRGAACLGWLRDVDAAGGRFRDRLKQARRNLLAKTSDLTDSNGIDAEVASELLREAHGLMGTAIRLYDLLEIDVIREIRFPNGAPTDPDIQQAFRKFVATATSVSSRYGAYSIRL